MTHDDELLAAGRLAAEALAGTVEVVGEVHQAVSRRVAGFLPPGARAIAHLQGAVSAAVFSAVAAGHRWVPEAVAALLHSTEAVPRRISDTGAGRFVLPAVNGIWGDTIAEHHPVLAVPTAVRVDGVDVPPDAEHLAAAFPHATGRLVVFVHGLAESETFWWHPPGGAVDDAAHPEHPVLSYGDRLQDDAGLTALYLRYNSGLRVSDNGARISELLAQVTGNWPVEVREIALVGHSMGGLVVRSACRHADVAGEPWVGTVRTVVTLGTPHLGAPLERAVHVADWVLSQIAETAPLGRLLRGRSAGVRDLRFGAVVPDDWSGHDPDALLLDTCTDVPFLPDATYYFIAASLTRDAAHPAGLLLGDGLVQFASAAGRGPGRELPFDEASRHLTGVHHFALLNHPEVYDLLREWLAP